MELVDGDPLAGLLAKHGRLSAEFTLDMLEQAGNALQAAHEQGLVHRDVKPGNILVTSAGQVKITDFGVAKAADAAPVTRSGMVMGTAHYIAPEQALGHPAEPASDVYSLAVCGYECLAGHRPFLSENAVTVAMMHIRDIAAAAAAGRPARRARGDRGDPGQGSAAALQQRRRVRGRRRRGPRRAAAADAVRAGQRHVRDRPAAGAATAAAAAAGQQPQPPSFPQPVPPQQQHMPVGPPSPAVNPMVAIGPPSRPVHAAGHGAGAPEEDPVGLVGAPRGHPARCPGGGHRPGGEDDRQLGLATAHRPDVEPGGPGQTAARGGAARFGRLPGGHFRTRPTMASKAS